MGVYAITGGASGIGAALAEQLRSRGDTVIVADIKDADVVSDLSTPEGRQAAVEGIKAQAPDGLDGFVPCAGLGTHIKPPSLIARVNYFAVIATVEGLRESVAKKRGSILFVSSNSAPMITNDNPFVTACLAGEAEDEVVEKATDGHTAYAGAKLAITRWMRQHTAEYAADGVRMNAVAPGMTNTPLTEAVRADGDFTKSMKDFEKMIPTGGAARPEQIAAAMNFLLSPEADFICGAVLFVDGGTDARLRPDSF